MVPTTIVVDVLSNDPFGQKLLDLTICMLFIPFCLNQKCRICLQASEDLKKEVFVSMKNDYISKVPRRDPLICCVGNLAMKRNIGNKVMRHYNVSSDMRLVARALIERRDRQQTISVLRRLSCAWCLRLPPPLRRLCRAHCHR